MSPPDERSSRSIFALGFGSQYLALAVRVGAASVTVGVAIATYASQ